MVGGLVQQEDVGPREHHPGQHTAHLLTAGEDLHRLVYLVPGEEHPAQEAPEVLLLGIGGELAQPLDQVVVVVLEVGGVILGEVGESGGLSPLHSALVWLHFSGQDLEQGGRCV